MVSTTQLFGFLPTLENKPAKYTQITMANDFENKMNKLCDSRIALNENDGHRIPKN